MSDTHTEPDTFDITTEFVAIGILAVLIIALLVGLFFIVIATRKYQRTIDIVTGYPQNVIGKYCTMCSPTCSSAPGCPQCKPPA